MRREEFTDEIGDDLSVAESASGEARGVIQTVRFEVCTGRRWDVVIVACIHQRISEHEHGDRIPSFHMINTHCAVPDDADEEEEDEAGERSREFAQYCIELHTLLLHC